MKSVGFACFACFACVHAVLFATVQPEMQYLRNEIGNHAVNLLFSMDHFVVFQCLCPSICLFTMKPSTCILKLHALICGEISTNRISTNSTSDGSVLWEKHSWGYYVTLHNVTRP